MDVENAIVESSHELRREEPHISRQAYQVNALFLQGRNYQLIVGLALESLRRNYPCFDSQRASLFNSPRVFTVAQGDGDFSVGNASGCHVGSERFEIRAAS